jgi:hypothetical protein
VLAEPQSTQDSEVNFIQTGSADIKGKAGNYSKAEILDFIGYLKSKHKPGSSGDIFRQVANGVFQAEGSVTGKFLSPSSHYFQPQLSISQNVSDASLRFMVSLYYALSEIGSIRVTLTSSNK